MQLFPRDSNDSAEVVFAGIVTAAGRDSIRLEMFRDGVLWSVDRAKLVYPDPGGAPFRLTGRIRAELSDYQARLYLDHTLIQVRSRLVCGDVFLINGQSNAVGLDLEGLATGRSDWLRSFGTSNAIPENCAADSMWGLAQGHFEYAHCGVGVWGLALGLSLIESYQIPVAILNGAVGGTPIVQHLRNDMAPGDLSTIYGRLLWRAEKAGVRRGVLALLWHQGESDTYDQWSQYPSHFGTLWNQWRDDYGPLQRVYVLQIHPGCGGEHQSPLREIQRTLPRSFPNVRLMSTVGLIGHDGCHYSFDGYNQMALWITRLVARDFYESSDTLQITPPDAQAASYSNPLHNEIRIRFDSEILWPADTLGQAMRDGFSLDGEWGHVESGRVDSDGRTVVLRLRPHGLAHSIGYLPGCCYPGSGSIYEGPWLRNPRGVGALSFDSFLVLDASGVEEAPSGSALRVLGSSPNPFQRSTEIHFQISRPQPVRIEVFRVSGEIVRTLADRWYLPGSHAVSWDGTAATGTSAAAGTYLYRLRGRDGLGCGKLLLLR